jgi:hypothetical protein
VVAAQETPGATGSRTVAIAQRASRRTGQDGQRAGFGESLRPWLAGLAVDQDQPAIRPLDEVLEPDRMEKPAGVQAADEQARVEDAARKVQELLEAEAAEAEAEFLSEGIEALETNEGREFSEQEIAVLASVARANPTHEGLPDLVLAHQLLAELQKSSQARWIESKKSTRRPGSGIAADRAVDLDNDEDRVQFMADRLAAAEQD